MSRLLRLLRSDAGRIAAGLALGQGCVFLATPFLSRLFAPDAFGAMAIALSVATIAATVGTFRIEHLLPRLSLTEAAQAGALATWTLAVTALIVCVASFTAAGFRWDLAIATGVVTLFLGLNAVAQQQLVRSKRLSQVGTSKAVQGIGQTVVQMAPGLSTLGGTGLLAGLITGYAGSYFILARQVRHTSRPTRRRMSALLHRHWHQLWKLTLASSFNVATIALPAFLLASYFGNAETGLYSVANRLAVIPTGLAVAALAPVILAGVSSQLRRGQQGWPTLTPYLRILLPAGVVTACAIAVIPEGWVATLLGNEFAETHKYLVAVAPLVGIQLAIGPVGAILAIYGKSLQQLVWDSSRFCAVLLVGVTSAVQLRSPQLTILAMSLTVVTFYVVYMILIRRADASLA